MTDDLGPAVEQAARAARDVLHNNLHGPCQGLPRAAAWGYREPYTRDMLLSSLAALATQDKDLMESLRRVLETLARNQSPLGMMPSLVHDPSDLGASDTTPLFLIALAFYRRVAGEPEFLREAGQKALVWMDYRSCENRVIVDQQPTTDWRDELWVPGYGLYVNALVYTYLKLFKEREKADRLYERMHRFAATETGSLATGLRGLLLPDKPYFAFWSFKEYSSDRFDLMGNSLAILSGLAPPSLAAEMILWIETECRHMWDRGQLAVDLPPCLFPFLPPGDPDYRARAERLNLPGCYANGGIWPFVCGFYVAALVAAGRKDLAEKKLVALTELVRHGKDPNLRFGFNEWHRSQDGLPRGQDWQTWSAALYVYAVECVRQGRTPLFDEVRNPEPDSRLRGNDTPA
ncbi:MAG: amylo-alpha-1,6-glucosidase [Planctomycetes bacterium RBG_13_62_9]|nr:MAG: amylo-alpha-1,6-glucosidase [Planctomycetes bacterium RBG_13_62_9]